MAKANYELLVGTHMVDAGAGEMVAKVAGDLVESHADLVALLGPTKFALSSVPADVVEVKEDKKTEDKKAGGK
jgi:hypothetical protein